MSRPPDRRVVAVDLDAVLASSDGGPGPIGEPLPGAAEFTKALAARFDVLVFTARVRYNPCGLSAPGYGADDGAADRPWSLVAQVAMVRDWLDRHGFAYHAVWEGAGKPSAAAFVDDRAVECRPQKFGASEYDAALRAVLELAGG